MKNLDKPFTIRELCGTGVYEDEFNERHGTNFKSWDELFREVTGIGKGGNPYAIDADDFYKRYLKWCKVGNTKLYKVLK